MRAVIASSRVISAFLGVIYIFGQLFFGIFEIASTIAGISGIIAGSLSATNRKSAWLLVPVCAVGILAIGADAYDYYASYQIPGNYYAWPEAVLFAAALLLIASGALMRLRN